MTFYRSSKSKGTPFILGPNMLLEDIGKMINVSIIVPTNSLTNGIQFCLRSLENQNYPKDFYEVVLVNDTNENISSIINNYKMNINVVIPTKHEKKGLATIRNCGITAAKYPLILFTDGDTIYNNNFIYSHVKFHGDKKKLVIIGNRKEIVMNDALNIDDYSNISDYLITNKVPIKQMDYHKQVIEKVFNNTKYAKHIPWVGFVTANASVAKETLQQVGLFDENMKEYGLEDLELGYRLFDNNCNYYFNSNNIAYHIKHQRSWRNLAGQKINFNYLNDKYNIPEIQKLLLLTLNKISINEYFSYVKKFKNLNITSRE